MERVLALSHLGGAALWEGVNAEVLRNECFGETGHSVGGLELIAVYCRHEVRTLEAAKSESQSGGVKRHLQVNLDLTRKGLSNLK